MAARFRVVQMPPNEFPVVRLPGGGPAAREAAHSGRATWHGGLARHPQTTGRPVPHGGAGIPGPPGGPIPPGSTTSTVPRPPSGPLERRLLSSSCWCGSSVGCTCSKMQSAAPGRLGAQDVGPAVGGRARESLKRSIVDQREVVDGAPLPPVAAPRFPLLRDVSAEELCRRLGTSSKRYLTPGERACLERARMRTNDMHPIDPCRMGERDDEWITTFIFVALDIALSEPACSDLSTYVIHLAGNATAMRRWFSCEHLRHPVPAANFGEQPIPRYVRGFFCELFPWLGRTRRAPRRHIPWDPYRDVIPP